MNDHRSNPDIEEAIFELRQTITTKEHFLQLLMLLRKDYSENIKEWENQNLEAYFEAMEAFCSSIEHYYANKAVRVDLDAPGWRVFADILLAARVYE